MNINVLLEDYMEIYQKSDLFDPATATYRSFKVRKATTIAELATLFSKTFKVDPDKMRMWTVSKNDLRIHKFTLIDQNANEPCSKHAYQDPKNSWTIFLEMGSPDSDHLDPIEENDLLIFFKSYDPIEKRLNYCGHGFFKAKQFLSDHNFQEECVRRAHFEPGTEIQLYEVTDINKATKIRDAYVIDAALSRAINGSIIIIEKVNPGVEHLEFPTCEEYLKDLYCRIEVVFVDTLNPNDTGFTLDLSSESNYDQIAKACGRRINVNPYEIQFFKCKNFSDIPGQPLPYTYTGTLKDILSYTKAKTVRKLFYQKLSISINELENKKQFRCLYLMPNLKEEKELILYPNKNGTVQSLLAEAAKVIEFSENSTKILRISELSKNRLAPGPSKDTPLDQLHDYTDNTFVQRSTISNQKMYRIEEVAEDEINLAENEMLVPVLHFTKDIGSIFGIPFFIRTVHQETFAALKERIKKKLNVSDKEWEKYKLAIITEHVDYIDDETIVINLEMFRPDPGDVNSRTYLGLEHINKNTKRSRFNYMEKAIKIYN